MTAGFQLDALDLAALLCSRVCHDVINPVGAIVNGLEVLEDENDPSMKSFALDLIKKSSRNASARLQFARIAFGAAGSAGASIDLGDAENVARGFIHDEKVALTWEAPRLLMPKNKVKLLLNLLVVSTSTIPRGGSVNAVVAGDADTARFEIVATGNHSRIPHGLIALLAGEPEGGTLDSHAIQPYYTGLVARAAGMSVGVESIEGGVKILAAPQTAAP
ncbi:histidine phosphotransferase ChpT [Labrys wisconsinensis]|uniref:Histidine phosphotransferase ChpT n=1 Tax=Labrys wisconsinensis TaxID=425677 RepID=A0ABU0JAR0_9HYPH|nr:histidine phosphotransferase family protein [Labrys wisconsinensis]MDQ0471356.1 histidine phosphotransferase ChpT [Labrys wisconsinensis]